MQIYYEPIRLLLSHAQNDIEISRIYMLGARHFNFSVISSGCKLLGLFIMTQQNLANFQQLFDVISIVLQQILPAPTEWTCRVQMTEFAVTHFNIMRVSTENCAPTQQRLGGQLDFSFIIYTLRFRYYNIISMTIILPNTSCRMNATVTYSAAGLVSAWRRRLNNNIYVRNF